MGMVFVCFFKKKKSVKNRVQIMVCVLQRKQMIQNVLGNTSENSSMFEKISLRSVQSDQTKNLFPPKDAYYVWKKT